QDTNAVSQTIEFLINCGCTRQGTTVFENAVRQYLREPCDFDLAKFPKPINGFYCFASPRELIASLSNQLVETRHSFDFNCTDAVIALADRRLQTALRPDDMVGPILATTWATNTHTEAISFAATARDAFSLGWSSWYREATDPL